MNWWWSYAAVGNHLWTWGSWVCSGGRVRSKTVDLPWRCVVGVRIMDEKAVDALCFISLIDISCQESSSWKSNLQYEPYGFDSYIYGEIIFMVLCHLELIHLFAKLLFTLYDNIRRGFSRMKARLVIIRWNSPIWCALALCDVGRAYDSFIFKSHVGFLCTGIHMELTRSALAAWFGEFPNFKINLKANILCSHTSPMTDLEFIVPF